MLRKFQQGLVPQPSKEFASLKNGSTPVSLLGHWLEAACGKRGFGANVKDRAWNSGVGNHWPVTIPMSRGHAHGHYIHY